MIAHRAMLDVPRELVVQGVATLLRVERRTLGTRIGSRVLLDQALMVLAWFRSPLVRAGFGVSRATAYRYRDEVVTVLAAPDRHEALTEVAEQGWPHVVPDGKVFRTDRCAESTTADTINIWYSGKHHTPGGNIHAVMRPDGVPIGTSDVRPGHLHDLT